MFVALKDELDKVNSLYSFLKKTTYRLANNHIKQIHGNYTNWRSFSEGFTSRLLERSRIYNVDLQENTWKESEDDAQEADELDDDFVESDIDSDEELDEDFEEFDCEDEEVVSEQKKENEITVQEQKTDVQLYEYLRNVRKKIQTYIQNNMNNIRYENLNRKSKVLINSYQIGREQAENTNLKFIDKSHQLTSKNKGNKNDEC